MTIQGDAEKNVSQAFVDLALTKGDVTGIVGTNIRRRRDATKTRSLPGVNVGTTIFQDPSVEGTNDYRGITSLIAETMGPNDTDKTVLENLVGALRDMLHDTDTTPIHVQLNQKADGVAFQEDGVHESNTDPDDEGKINRRVLNVDIAFWVGTS